MNDRGLPGTRGHGSRTPARHEPVFLDPALTGPDPPDLRFARLAAVEASLVPGPPAAPRLPVNSPPHPVSGSRAAEPLLVPEPVTVPGVSLDNVLPQAGGAGLLAPRHRPSSPGQGTPPPGSPAERASPGQRRSRATSPNVALIVTVAVSLGLHLVALAVALLLLRTAVPVADLPDKATEVELVMEEHKGDLAPTASTPSPPRTATATPSKQQAEPVAPPEEAQPAETPSPPAKPPVDARSNAPQETAEPAVASIPAPQATPTPEQPVRPSPEPTPPAAQPAPKISLQGTDSPSDARAWGEHVIPASPDAVFHNRPPEYPTESVLRGERGTVVVVVHVSPAGTAEGVDVLHSSGYALLDGAVRVAVMRWRFLPAVKAGASVASDVTMGFIFDNN